MKKILTSLILIAGAAVAQELDTTIVIDKTKVDSFVEKFKNYNKYYKSTMKPQRDRLA